MSDPRGAVGDAPETTVPASSDDARPRHADAPDAPTETTTAETATSDARPVAEPATEALPAPAAEPPLDASAHAHLLSEPLPPGAATETAVIYHVTLGEPHSPGAGSADRADPAPVPAAEAAAVPDARPGPPISRRSVPTSRRVGATGAVVLVTALACLSGYLWISATEWRDHAQLYERTAASLGDDLASARNQLAGTQAELEAVRAQLATAHERIVELADEKNQALDDWELTQQVVDYQQRVSNAAGEVALALDQCVQGQQELIGLLEQQVNATTPTPPPYDPEIVAEFEAQVEKLCQDASEANIALQLELAR